MNENYDETWDDNEAPVPEVRKAGDYIILLSTHIGDREVVVGEDENAEAGQRYLCAFCERDALFALYNECLVSDDYAEIVQIYGERIVKQAEKAAQIIQKPLAEGIPHTILTKNDCHVITGDDRLSGEVVVIRPDSLRREYQTITHQLKLCVGGFGAEPHSRGNACFCIDLYTGEEGRYNRSDVLGILQRDELPEWAKKQLAKVRHKEKQGKECER